MIDAATAPQWLVDAAIRYEHGAATEIDRLLAEPELLFRKIGHRPDSWQIECMNSRLDLLLNNSRQVGKSAIASAVALQTLLAMPPSLVLIISPSERQSGELMKDKFGPMYEPWKKLCPLVKDNEHEKTFANGSRLVALPGKTDANIRSYSSVGLLIMDEASRIPDFIYEAVTPMLAVSGGRQLALSTPYGKRGWFYNEWVNGIGWKKISIRGDQCPRLVNAVTRDGRPFLEAEKAKKGYRAFSQEFCCAFEANTGAVFLEEDITAAFVGLADMEFPPLDLFGPVGVQPEYLHPSERIEI